MSLFSTLTTTTLFPAPGSYFPEKVKDKGPEFSMSGRTYVEKKDDTPGTNKNSLEWF